MDGNEYRMIYAGEDQGPPRKEDVLAAVDAWKSGINAALEPHGLGPIEWSEEDTQPYYTNRPSWEGYSAIQQWAAHLERPNLSVPYLLPESYASGTAMASILEDDKNLHFRSILQGGVWLPGDFEFLFKFPALTDGEIMIGSTGRLLRELNELKGRPLIWDKELSLSLIERRIRLPFRRPLNGHCQSSRVLSSVDMLQKSPSFCLSRDAL
jgi:hypothetical protein